MKKKDLLLIAAILLLALLVWRIYFGGKKGNYAEVIFDGVILKTVYLDKDMTFSVSEVPHVEFEIKDGAIAFIHSNCPDQVCVYTGYLDGPNQFAACLPNRIMLWVSSDEKDQKGIDVIAK